MKIIGSNIDLKPAVISDRKKIYLWLTKSNLTPSMMGEPNYPDAPIPTWKEFSRDYQKSFFNSSGNTKGKNFIILAKNIEVGTVGYDLFDQNKSRVVLDIWLRAEKYCGHGYGSDALKTLCRYLNQKYGIRNFFISPSSRNKRAIKSYLKTGFKLIKMSRNRGKKEFDVDIFDYDDNVVMKKSISNNAFQPPPKRRG